ncbi:hypothetical protein GKZ89_00365 [Bacillus mangrovi]|uniref:Small, acid-soluble spore protein N n=1 Tax=Metabacillus mangrovi TaxID=1491830 RepID=A0A7X2V2Q1_9BACI|nr:hypothetical protein [Metabacillus mangrovi]MTH51840.1 hypothetical protein [Metabacillus mangrovi]
MPHYKNKQQSFQAAQQEATETVTHFQNMDPASPDYGSHLKHLKEEIRETNAQIQNALENASEHQRAQLETFKRDISRIVKETGEEDQI